VRQSSHRIGFQCALRCRPHHVESAGRNSSKHRLPSSCQPTNSLGCSRGRTGIPDTNHLQQIQMHSILHTQRSQDSFAGLARCPPEQPEAVRVLVPRSTPTTVQSPCWIVLRCCRHMVQLCSTMRATGRLDSPSSSHPGRPTGFYRRSRWRWYQ
jgi:hypothetical protein